MGGLIIKKMLGNHILKKINRVFATLLINMFGKNHINIF